MAKKVEKAALEVIPPTPPPVMVWDDEEAARREAKYLPALEALLAGKSTAEAARCAHVSESGLLKAIARSPALFGEMRVMRSLIRDIAYLRAMAILNARLNDPDKVGNRDLTDMLRALKPPQENVASNVTVVIDV